MGKDGMVVRVKGEIGAVVGSSSVSGLDRVACKVMSVIGGEPGRLLAGEPGYDPEFLMFGWRLKRKSRPGICQNIR